MAEILSFPPKQDASREGSSALPPDYEARERALDIRSSCIVEAPAGSGKTGLLLQRFLKLLAQSEVAEPEEVLAITFTRKATAELRERVLGELHSAASGVSLPDDASAFKRETRMLAEAVLAVDARRGWNLLEQPQRLRIRTIDSLCGEIARTLPVLSGSGALRPVEDAKPIYRDAARRTLMRLGGPDVVLDAALRTVLLHRDGRLDDCERLLAGMLEQRDQWAEFVPLDRTQLSDEYLEEHVRPRLERSLEAIVCAGLRHALQSMPPGLIEELTELASRFGLEPGYKDELSPLTLCAGRQEPPLAHPDHLDHWLALIHLVLKPADGEWRRRFQARDLHFEIRKTDTALLQQLVEEIQTEELREALHAIRSLPPTRYPDEQWEVAKALFHLLRHTLAELKVLFSETGQCDFTEQALAARAALDDGGAADLANSPVTRLTHLLVDEMQDTSSSQYALLELLTRSWDGRSQTLFLVGDPKQSIYLFRQARVERFLRTVRERRLGEIPLEALQLTANFRSQAALVEGFNDLFSQLFPRSMEGAASSEAPDVPFVRAHPVREAALPSAITWHTEALGDGLPSDAQSSGSDLRSENIQKEARAIRQIIEKWRARPLPADRRRREDGTQEPWRIAILTRARSHLAAITAELSRTDGSGPIPYRAVQIDPLGERPEVLDAVALTRALLHPADRTAWLAVLRAPWCGLSLSDLLTLTGDGFGTRAQATVPELVEQNRDQLSSEGQRLLDRTWPVLRDALGSLGRSSLAVHVERTWRSLGGDAPLSQDRKTNVRRFFEVVRDLEANGSRIDLSQLAARLSDLYAEPATDDNAVEILTIHKSKGLEFDVVLVPGLHRVAHRPTPGLLNWLEIDSTDAEAAHLLLAPIWSPGEDSDRLNGWLGRVRRAREYGEIKRVLYVACTRAKEELHLFAATPRNRDQSLRQPNAGSLLKACWPAAYSRFAAVGASDRATAADPGGTVPPETFDPYEGEMANGFALAASAESPARQIEGREIPIVHRLPLSFDPLARFTTAESTRLPYTPASLLPNEPAFARPEGSFGVRAFGNVVHRFLQHLSACLERGIHPDALLAELPSWKSRLIVSLRGEGLAPAEAQREASRALTALHHSLSDPIGCWILAPHPGAANERSLATSSAVLRADRTFLAGADPLTAGDECIWIIDFKTTEQGGRTDDLFAQQELLKYRVQLESYATVRRSLPDGGRPIHLGLFYPLIPRLILCPPAPSPIE